jgi:hypothetical protein
MLKSLRRRSCYPDVCIAVALFLFFTGLYGMTARGHFSIADEETMFHVTEGLVERGTFTQLPESESGPVPRALVKGKQGLLYAVTGPVQSILAVPFYLIGQCLGWFFPDPFYTYLTRFFVALFNSPVGALTVAFLYLSARELSYRRRSALFTAVALGLGSVLWPYARTFFAESLLALWLTISTWAIIRYARTDHAFWLVVWASAFSLGVLTKYVMVISFPLYMLYLFSVFYRHSPETRLSWLRRTVLAAVIPLFIFALMGAAFNYTRFDSILETGYTKSDGRGAISSWGSKAQPLIGWYGYLFSSGKGFFFFSPPAILLFLGLSYLYAQRRDVTLLLLSLILIYPLFYTLVTHRWHGGGNWGPRYIVCVTPLVLLIGGAFLERRDLAHWVQVFAATAILVVGFWVQASFLYVNYATYLFGNVPSEKQLYQPKASPLAAQWRLWPHQMKRWQNYDLDVRNSGRDFYVLKGGFHEIEVPDMAPFGRWVRAESKFTIYARPAKALNLFFEYSTSHVEAPKFFYDGMAFHGKRELVREEGGNYQWREELTVPAEAVQIWPGTLKVSLPSEVAQMPEDDRELGLFLSKVTVTSDGQEIVPLDVELPSPMPLVQDHPWSWNAMFWFYNPTNARPFDLWPAYVWTSGIPLNLAKSFIWILSLICCGCLIGSALWLKFLVSREL